ncbi:MAG: hypothetical protein A3H98_12550 [Bacteroidetes bacterium RIFCSPLOWO2_02_FULL_36_8]|nr:MAG: hypothetical protein A3H98_12550 [Bacteroidetes bacterium RIFCSPLOWO2_02_FULL_36_8]OFY69982.1 MAG: hypothetical protein A3G23_05570 [Bacteroidetes bacterium RIFCSPLOWO2_12_FULL_37_12]
MIAKIVGGVLQPAKSTISIEHLLTDSRKLLFPEQSLFFAIRGLRHNGHEFLSELYKKNCRNWVVESGQESYYKKFRDVNFIKVSNAIDALQKLSSYHRRQFQFPVIAITGSNGKTVVKEWLNQLLSSTFNIVKSPRSFNSQIGVPLSVWEMREHHSLGIFEAGISRCGEMDKLEDIIKPDIGIITNIGEAHSAGFNSLKEKINEKIKLFKNCHTIFYPAHFKEIETCLKATYLQPKKLLGWTYEKLSDKSDDYFLSISSAQAEAGGTKLEYVFKNKTSSVFIPFTDKAGVENSISCLCFLLYFNLPEDEIKSRMVTLKPLEMRMELKAGINQCTIINDTYNNDLVSLETSLEFLCLQTQNKKKTLILSDILQSDKKADELYARVSKMVFQKGVDRFIGIGSVLQKNQSFFPKGSKFFSSTNDFFHDFHPDNFINEAILLKGARVFELEKIAQKLQMKTHETVLEINLNALLQNLHFFRARLNPGTGIIAMVKAFSYGSGSYEIANFLQYHGVNYLAVAYIDEGVLLREKGIHLPILVMNPQPGNFDKLLEYGLEPEIFRIEQLEQLIPLLQNRNKNPKVTDKKHSKKFCHIHIKLDTGMRRLGFEVKQTEIIIGMLKKIPEIKVASVFSHLAAADDINEKRFTLKQISTLKKFAHRLEKELGYPMKCHILNTPGLLNFPQAQMDYVRLGIGLYGTVNDPESQSRLHTVAQLKTSISQIRKLKKGDTVGYSRKGKAKDAMKIATIGIGYADGFDRRFGNGVGSVIINGKKAPVVGNICMDMCMVDITGIDAEEGNEVLVFGEENPIWELATKIGTIPYEILTKVGERVKRVYYNY